MAIVGEGCFPLVYPLVLKAMAGFQQGTHQCFQGGWQQTEHTSAIFSSSLLGIPDKAPTPSSTPATIIPFSNQCKIMKYTFPP